MEDRKAINDSFCACRHRSEGRVAVMSTTQYVMAEYDDKTGDIRWQRVVNASQRESVYNWLRQHFPVKNQPAPVARRKVAVA